MSWRGEASEKMESWPHLSTCSGESNPIIDFDSYFKRKRALSSTSTSSPCRPLLPVSIPVSVQDDRWIFTTFSDPITPYSLQEMQKESHPSQSRSHSNSSLFPVNVPISTTEEGVLGKELQQSSYHPIQMKEWEKEIVWEPIEEGKGGKISTRRKGTRMQGDVMQSRQYRWEMSEEEEGEIEEKQEEQEIKLPSKLNTALEAGDWIHDILWTETASSRPSRVCLDLNDQQLIVTDVDNVDEIRPTLRIPQRKLGMAEQKRATLEVQAREKKSRLDAVKGNLEFGDGTAEGRMGGDKKSKESSVLKNLDHVPHSVPAMKLSLTKPELPRNRCRFFHRPKGKFKPQEHLVFLQMPKEKAAIDYSQEIVVAPIKKVSDLNPSNAQLLIVEYSEESPPILMSPGMASRIDHYWRPDPTNPQAQPAVENGRLIVLGRKDHTPFVGEAPPGKIVSSLNCKLFKCPIFKQTPTVPTFLLARYVPRSKGVIGAQKSRFHIKFIGSVHVAGQTEPQMEVPAPGSRTINDFIRPYMTFHIARLFKRVNVGERLKIEDIQNAFPHQSTTAIRKRMKELATFERGGNDSGWWKRKEGAQFKGEDELRANITPDSVCLYESMMSGHRKLLDLGLSNISSVAGVEGAVQFLLKRLEARRDQLKMFLPPESQLAGKARETQFNDLLQKDRLYKQLETDILVGRFIHEKLELTPWNLTNNYVYCHLHNKASGMLKLGGLGDPSGRGEGFSFIRIPQSRIKKADTADASTAGPSQDVDDSSEKVDKFVAAVTGTTSDLRKLKMKEAGDVLHNLGVPREDIKKLRRWDRVGLIRELSTRATAHGIGGQLSKFARGDRKSLSAQQQDYHRRCDVIFARQYDVLSSEKAEFSSEEEDDEDEDLEDYGIDLEEEMMGATRGKDASSSLRGPKNLFSKNGGGLNRSKEALAEREESAELRRLREEMNHPTTAASKPTEETSSASALSTRPGSSPVQVERRKVLRRIIRTVQEDGTETTRIEFICDPSRIQSFEESLILGKQKKIKKIKIKVPKKSKISMLDDPDISADRKTKILQDELKQLTKAEEKNKDYQHMLEINGEDYLKIKAKNSTGVRCKRCLQAGHIKTNKKCPLYPTDQEAKAATIKEELRWNADVVQSKGDPLKLKIKKSAVGDPTKCTLNLSVLQKGHRNHQALQKKRKIAEMNESKELYARPGAASSSKRRRYRMPICHLNSKFETIFYHSLWPSPESHPFREKVDGEKYSDYYGIIEKPMHLQLVLQRIHSFYYTTSKEFIHDIELIALNAKLYNGESAISKTANRLVSLAKDAVAQMNAEGEIARLEKLARSTGAQPVVIGGRKSSM